MVKHFLYTVHVTDRNVPNQHLMPCTYIYIYISLQALNTLWSIDLRDNVFVRIYHILYKISIILMSHVGRSLFFGRASFGVTSCVNTKPLSDNCQVSILCTKGVWLFLCGTALGMTFFILSSYWCDVCEVLGDHPKHYLCNCKDPIEE